MDLRATLTQDCNILKKGERVRIVQFIHTQQATGLSFGNMSNNLHIEVYVVVVTQGGRIRTIATECLEVDYENI